MSETHEHFFIYSEYLEMLGIVHLRRFGDYNEGEMNGVKVLYQFIDSPFVSNPDTHSLSTNMLKRAYLY